MCFEFLQIDDRPTAILEVQPITFRSGAVDRLKVNILFTNPAFEHLKPQLKLDFEFSTSMGGILQQADGKLVWVVPNCDWELRCVSISRGAVTGDYTVATVGGGHRWWKVMTASPVLPLLIPNSNDAEDHPNTLDPTKNASVLESHAKLKSHSGIGGEDVQLISEKPTQITPESSVVTTNRPGVAGDWTLGSSKTITPTHTAGLTSSRRSLVSSTNASRRSSWSPPSSRRDSGSVDIPEVVTEKSESLSLPSESVPGGRFGNKSNMDWTRGAMPRKNIQDLAGMDEHLGFLRDVLW